MDGQRRYTRIKVGWIFDLDQTIIDSSTLAEFRKNRQWRTVHDRLNEIVPYEPIVSFIKARITEEEPVAIVTSSPRDYLVGILGILDIDPESIVTVAYHDTQSHKPYPEPIQYALNHMHEREAELQTVFCIGDVLNDFKAAESARPYAENELNIKNYYTILALWGNPAGANELEKGKPHVSAICKDANDFARYVSMFRFSNFYEQVKLLTKDEHDDWRYLLHYYTYSGGKQDFISVCIMDYIKKTDYPPTKFTKRLLDCFSYAIGNYIREHGMQQQTGAFFVIPSSKLDRYNPRITDVATTLANKYPVGTQNVHCIRRITERDQAHTGGDRSVEGNLQTMGLNTDGYSLSDLNYIWILDDVTTSGNSFEACEQLLRNAGYTGTIICAALAETTYIH